MLGLLKICVTFFSYTNHLARMDESPQESTQCTTSVTRRINRGKARLRVTGGLPACLFLHTGRNGISKVSWGTVWSGTTAWWGRHSCLSTLAVFLSRNGKRSYLPHFWSCAWRVQKRHNGLTLKVLHIQHFK